jgi:hypothetical protein
MDETRTDGDDDDEEGYSEDDHGEDERVLYSIPQVSHRPEPQDQNSEGPSWCSQEPPGLYEREKLTIDKTLTSYQQG